MKIYEILWESMEIYGNLRKPMESMKTDENLWKSMGIYENLWNL